MRACVVRMASGWSARANHQEPWSRGRLTRSINPREMYPRALMSYADAAARSRMPRKSLAGPSVLITGPSVVRIDAADDVVEPPSSIFCAVSEW